MDHQKTATVASRLVANNVGASVSTPQSFVSDSVNPFVPIALTVVAVDGLIDELAIESAGPELVVEPELVVVVVVVVVIAPVTAKSASARSCQT